MTENGLDDIFCDETVHNFLKSPERFYRIKYKISTLMEPAEIHINVNWR